MSEREHREMRESREREREAMSICEIVKTEKWYYVCNTRSADFPREREREREREAMSICETVKAHEMVLCP